MPTFMGAPRVMGPPSIDTKIGEYISDLRVVEGQIKCNEPTPAIEKIADIVSKLSVAIATCEPSDESQKEGIKATLIYICKHFESRNWSEAEIKNKLPQQLMQGITTCCNLLIPDIPIEIANHPAFHANVLKTAISHMDSTNKELTPRDCVRRYCVDALAQGKEIYNTELYMLRPCSTNCCVASHEMAFVILTLTKNVPPKTEDDIDHFQLNWDYRKKVWTTSGVESTWSNIDAFLKEKFPNHSGLVSPSLEATRKYVTTFYLRLAASRLYVSLESKHIG